MNNKQLAQNIMDAFSPENVIKIENADPESDLYKIAKKTEQYLTASVHLLRSSSDELLHDLGQYVWDVFHHRRVLMGFGMPVQSLSMVFRAQKKAGLLVQEGTVAPPMNWVELCKQDPFLQFGAVIYVSSQAADFYNDRFIKDGPEIVKTRAYNYEAIYLNIVKQICADYKFNEYQKEILNKYQEFDTSLLYQYKQVLPMN